MNVLLLCAGFATRMYPLTRDFPKPLLEVAGQTILDRLLRPLLATGAIDAVHVITNARFASHFERWRETYSREQAPPIHVLDDGATDNDNRLGAVADLALAIEHFGLTAPLLVAAGDNLFDFRVADFVEDHRRSPRNLVAACREQDPARLRRTGVAEVDETGRMLKLWEKPADPPSTFSCPALYIFEQPALDALPTFLAEAPESDAPGHFVSWLVERQPVFTHVIDGRRLDVGNIESYEGAAAWLAQR